MLTEHGIVDADKIRRIENEVEQTIEAAITFAMEVGPVAQRRDELCVYGSR